jgi:hypothetical protein
MRCITRSCGFAISTICFALAPVVLMKRSEITRPVPRREFLIVAAILVGFITLIFLANHLLPHSSSETAERVMRYPALVVPLWVAMMACLFWRWRREKRLASA